MTGPAGRPTAASREPRRLRVCFVQAYRAPRYVRGESICGALRESGEIELIDARNTSPGPIRYWQALRALMQARHRHDPDVYILGFRGHEIAWLVRWLTRNRPMVIDAMMSPYGALAEESKFGAIGRLLARFWRPYEEAILKASDSAITDTPGHVAFYRRQFGLPPDRVLAVPVGADERRTADPDGDRAGPGADAIFRVLFYGSFLPLHGVDVVLAAAARLTDRPVEFRLIGGTRRQAQWLAERCRALGVVRYTHARWIAFDRILDEEIPRADLCLGGPFGGTAQARRVVTGKTSQCLAMGKPTVVGRIEGEVPFVDRDNCLLVDQADPDGLADAIRWAECNRAALAGIGMRGRDLYDAWLSRAAIRKTLVPHLQELASQCRSAS